MSRLSTFLFGKINPAKNATSEEVAEYLSRENLEAWAKKSGFNREIDTVSGLMEHYNVQNYVDIGANIGYVFLESTKKYGKPVNAYLFEPVPLIFQALDARVKEELPKNSSAKCYNIGLGTEKETSTIYIDLDGNYGWNTMRRDKITRHMYPVEITIDRLNVFSDEIAGIDLMKIDVEGYESKVLEGGMDAILKFQPVIYLELAWAKQNKLWPDQLRILTDLTENQGYTMLNEDQKIISIADLEGTADIILVPRRFQ